MDEKKWTVEIMLWSSKKDEFRLWKTRKLRTGFELGEMFVGFRIISLHSYGISRKIIIRLMRKK